MKIINKPFTNEEIEMIRYSFKRVADKHGCNPSYVSLIANGHREVNSIQTKNIIKTLKKILHVLKPI